MEQFTINLPDEIAAQLKTAAQKAGVKPEDFLLEWRIFELENPTIQTSNNPSIQ